MNYAILIEQNVYWFIMCISGLELNLISYERANALSLIPKEKGYLDDK